jgi:transposase
MTFKTRTFKTRTFKTGMLAIPTLTDARSPYYLGIDVSKDWLDIASSSPDQPAEPGQARQGQSGQGQPGQGQPGQGQPGQGQWRIDNTPEAIQAFLESLAYPPVLVAFEPTGGYERKLRQALVAAGLPFARINLNELAAYRTQNGIKAKTDRIDARLIADFAATVLARRWLAPMVENDPLLEALSVRRRQLGALLQTERCRAEIADSRAIRQSLEAVIATLEASLHAIDAEIAAYIAADPALARTAALLRSLKGVGPITVLTLLAELPELGQRDGKQIASLVGLAPHDHQSGKMSRRARTGHGRPGVRRVLFNVARSAIRHNPILKAFYDKLVTHNHRPGKVALTAVMRKVIVILNAIVRDQKPWQHA